MKPKTHKQLMWALYHPQSGTLFKKEQPFMCDTRAEARKYANCWIPAPRVVRVEVTVNPVGK